MRPKNAVEKTVLDIVSFIHGKGQIGANSSGIRCRDAHQKIALASQIKIEPALEKTSRTCQCAYLSVWRRNAMNQVSSYFPALRLRRLRQSSALRSLVSESSLQPSDLIWPIFLREGENIRQPIDSMPGVFRYSVDQALEVAKEALDLGIPAICLFPHTESDKRSADCSEAWNPENLSNVATRTIKKALPELAIMTDVALDTYSDTGHDGFLVNGEVLNDSTVEALVKQALSQAEAGADIIGPSDMMDGRIGAIREALERAEYDNVMLLSYAAKYASTFYGPFREAVGTYGALNGDKKSYQIDPANSNEALRCVARDLAEGADMVMIKPGMPYLDICRKVKDGFGVPTFAYQVSGEYAMIMAASRNGWLDLEKAMFESLMAFKRAGCDGILTYFALAVAKKMN